MIKHFLKELFMKNLLKPPFFLKNCRLKPQKSRKVWTFHKNFRKQKFLRISQYKFPYVFLEKDLKFLFRKNPPSTSSQEVQPKN